MEEKHFNKENLTLCRDNLFFYTEIDDHGIRQRNTGHMIAQWWRSVASKAALDMLRWAMCSALHWRIVMALKMAPDGGTFFRCRRLFRLTYRSKIT